MTSSRRGPDQGVPLPTLTSLAKAPCTESYVDQDGAAVSRDGRVDPDHLDIIPPDGRQYGDRVQRPMRPNPFDYRLLMGHGGRPLQRSGTFRFYYLVGVKAGEGPKP